MKFSELQECPFCGHDEYYSKEYVYGNIFYGERFDGEETHNESLYDSLSTKRFNGRCYCRSCEKYLGNKLTDIVSKMAQKALKESEDTE